MRRFGERGTGDPRCQLRNSMLANERSVNKRTARSDIIVTQPQREPWRVVSDARRNPIRARTTFLFAAGRCFASWALAKD